MMGELGKRVDGLLRDLNKQLAGMAAQVTPVEAAYRYERAEQGKSETQQVLPGFESKAENAAYIKPIIDVQTSAVRVFVWLSSFFWAYCGVTDALHFPYAQIYLFGAIGMAEDEIVIFDRVFRPKELVKTKCEVSSSLEPRDTFAPHSALDSTHDAQNFLREVYRQECIRGEVPPPSKLARAFGLAAQCLQLVGGYIDLDTSAMFRRVLFAEACHGS
jgi:hypothetical protein